MDRPRHCCTSVAIGRMDDDVATRVPPHDLTSRGPSAPNQTDGDGLCVQYWHSITTRCRQCLTGSFCQGGCKLVAHCCARLSRHVVTDSESVSTLRRIDTDVFRWDTAWTTLSLVRCLIYDIIFTVLCRICIAIIVFYISITCGHCNLVNSVNHNVG